MNHRETRTLGRNLWMFLAVALGSLPARAEQQTSDRRVVEAAPDSQWRFLPGARLRVTAAGFAGPMVGTTVEYLPDRLSVMDRKSGSVRDLSLSSIARIEASHLRTRARTGLWIGIGLGLLSARTRGSSYWGAPLVFGALGAWAGSAMHTDQWFEVPGALGDRAIAPAATPSPAGPPLSVPRSQARSASGPVDEQWRRLASTRVRIHNEGQKTQGHMISLSAQGLRLVGSSGITTIERGAVTRVEAWGGEKGRALKGALVGAVLAAAANFRDDPSCLRLGAFDGPYDCSRVESVVSDALPAALLGAIVGHFVKKTTWVATSLNGETPPERRNPSTDLNWQLTPMFARNSRGAGLRLNVSW